jgi:hypothetical protein
MNTGSSISISVKHIVCLTKLQQRQTLRKEFALMIFEKTNFLEL